MCASVCVCEEKICHRCVIRKLRVLACVQFYVLDEDLKVTFSNQKAHRQEISDVKFSPDDMSLAVGSHDCTVTLWDVSGPDDLTLRARCKGHSSYITHLDWTDDSTVVQTNCGAYELLFCECGMDGRVSLSPVGINAMFSGYFSLPLSVFCCFCFMLLLLLCALGARNAFLFRIPCLFLFYSPPHCRFPRPPVRVHVYLSVIVLFFWGGGMSIVCGEKLQRSLTECLCLWLCVSGDAFSGDQITRPSTLRDSHWATWTCTLGWPVQAIWDTFAKGCDVKAVDRAHNEQILATGEGVSGKLKLLRYPCTGHGYDNRGTLIKPRPEYKDFQGHSSFVTNCRFSADDSKLYSTGGADRTVLQWAVQM